MMKKTCSLVLSILVISAFLCSGSFAQESCPQNYISVSSDLTLYNEWCDGPALDDIKLARQAQEQALYATLPPYQQALYNETKTKLEGADRLASLISIQVYSATVSFETIQDFYIIERDAGKLHLEDVKAIANSRNITNVPDKLLKALAKIPTEYFPPDDVNGSHKGRLEAYIGSQTDASLKGLIGTSIEPPGSDPPTGQSNISILPIYVNPETYYVHDQVTDPGIQAWVIISTYSKPFVKPPLERTPTP
jgi:hypothetical protein